MLGEAVAALICSRLCSPSPLYDIAGWASGAALAELLGIPAALLNDDRLGRALEILAVYSETLRGTLAARAIERFGIDAGRLHVDLTALRVCGAYEGSALIAKGWAQGQGVARQVRALQASTADGVSVYVRPSMSWWATPNGGRNRRSGGHGEGLRRSHSEAAGAQLGAYLVNRSHE